jgi:hypothetical protein
MSFGKQPATATDHDEKGRETEKGDESGARRDPRNASIGAVKKSNRSGQRTIIFEQHSHYRNAVITF